MTTRIGLVALAFSALAMLSPAPAEAYWTFFATPTMCSGEPDNPNGAAYCDITDSNTGVRAMAEEEGNSCKATVFCADGVFVLYCYASPELGDNPGLCASWTSSGGHINCKSDGGIWSNWC